MDFWDILEYAAWAISIWLLASMLIDAYRVSQDYSEDLLLSSREGELDEEDLVND